MRMRITILAVLMTAILAAGCGTEPADHGKDAKTTAGTEISDDADSKTDSDTDSPAADNTEEKTEVRREKYDDCDGSGHGYVEIYYSDGSMETEEY